MENSSEYTPEPANLKLLRRLVTVLLVVMIFGFITLITLFVMRFSAPALENTVSNIELPAGITATAYTKGPDWYAIVTDDNNIHIYNSSDNSLRQLIKIKDK